MKIALASDHAGYRHKEEIKAHLAAQGHEVRDLGTHSEQSVDYPLLIRPAAQAVARGECDLGIVFGGSGNGEAIVANKVAGIRCAVVWNETSARYAREHNNANMIAIGQRLVTIEIAMRAVDVWLATTFAGGRHARRVREISAVEEAWCDQ
ncbi:MAG: ribose 5-phosphate isomerase B [Anaerolineae bacterium]|jgi:ribose 5-phosphate isomerase B